VERACDPPGHDDVPLRAGRHELRVEYFQAGGSYKLWVRIEPLDDR